MGLSASITHVDMINTSAAKELGTSMEVLTAFLSSVDRLERAATEANIGDAVAVARIAWASIYDMVLLAGAMPHEEAAAFAAALDRCAHLTAGAGEWAKGYVKQLEWYRRLIGLYGTKGVQAVNEAIDDAFVAADELSDLSLTFAGAAPSMHCQPG